MHFKERRARENRQWLRTVKPLAKMGLQLCAGVNVLR